MIIQIGNKDTQVFVNTFNFYTKIHVHNWMNGWTYSINLYLSEYNYLIASINWVTLCTHENPKIIQLNSFDPTNKYGTLNKDLWDMIIEKKNVDLIREYITEKVDVFKSTGYTIEDEEWDET